jgi:hypothetical protein
MQIRATNACSFDLNDYIIITTSWAIHFTDFDAVRFG